LNTLSNLTVRLMFNRDLRTVLEIERKRPGEPWTRRDFLPVFRAPDTEGWVAEIDDQVVGFIVFRVHPDGLGRRISVLNVGVAPYWRRAGVARSMFLKLADRLRAPGDSLQATVPESNLALQLCLRAAGFKAVRVLRGHFVNEDGYVMRRCWA
jgi:[ribosomal protein S18]-alanine N-acetyltransferase